MPHILIIYIFDKNSISLWIKMAFPVTFKNHATLAGSDLPISRILRSFFDSLRRTVFSKIPLIEK